MLLEDLCSGRTPLYSTISDGETAVMRLHQCLHKVLSGCIENYHVLCSTRVDYKAWKTPRFVSTQLAVAKDPKIIALLHCSLLSMIDLSIARRRCIELTSNSADCQLCILIGKGVPLLL